MWEQTGTVSGTHDSAFARSHFAYDNLSRLTASWRDEQAGKGEWFGYHATGQLTDVAYNADNVSSGTPQNATRTVNYTVTPDTLNRSIMNDTGELSVYTPNALNQYTDINGGGLYYDGNFNLMWTGGFSAGYDADKRLTAIGSGEDYGTFTCDGLGRCLKRTIDWETILITYDGWKPIIEFDQWNNLKAWNIYGTGPDEILYRHDAYLSVDLRYHRDRMGNVAFVLNGTGEGIERYTYDAFGSPTVTDWDGNNPRTYSWYGNRFMFTGREYFPELGLYDYRFRFYHPMLGRFLQSDPIGFGGGDPNLFRYCGGDAVNRRDPSGLIESCGDGPCIPIRPLEPFANGAQSLPGVSGADLPGSNVGGPGPGGPSGGPSGPAGGPGFGGSGSGSGILGGGDKGGLFGPAMGANGLFGSVDSHFREGGGGGSNVSFTQTSSQMSLSTPRIPAASAGGIFTSVTAAGMAAIQSKGTGFTIEDAGLIFQNPDGTIGFTDPMDPRNTVNRSYPGLAPSGSVLVGFWHLHPGSSPFNPVDIGVLNQYNVPGYLGGADGSIRMYLPATGQQYILKGP
jgi:RHS repeat-associated protein